MNPSHRAVFQYEMAEQSLPVGASRNEKACVPNWENGYDAAVVGPHPRPWDRAGNLNVHAACRYVQGFASAGGVDGMGIAYPEAMSSGP